MPAPAAELQVPYLPVAAAARRAGVTEMTLRRWVTIGRLTKYALHGRTVVSVAELDSIRPPATAAK